MILPTACKRAGLSLPGLLLLGLFSAPFCRLAAQESPEKEATPILQMNDSSGLVYSSSKPQLRVFPPPLTGKERWHRYLHDTFLSGPIYYASVGAALEGQVINTPKEWGRNWSGYGKRTGTMYASFAIQNSIYQAGSAALHNEGRYVACQCKGTWRRAGYALQMTFLTYHNGHKVLDVPQFVGAYGGGMIPVLWYPKGYRPTVQGVQIGHIEMGYLVGVRELQEFAPELKRLFGHKHEPVPSVDSQLSIQAQ